MKSFLSARIGALLFAFAAVVVPSAPAAAASLFQPVTATEAQRALNRPVEMGSLALRSRVARIDTGELARHVAPLDMDAAADRIERARALDGTITIDLFPGVSATFQRESIESISDSGYAWVGKIGQSPVYFASLIVRDGAVNGHIQLLHRIFKILPLGNGLHRIVELDHSKFPADEPPGHIHDRTTPGSKGESLPTPRVRTTIRVLAAFTPAARNEAGGTANIVDEIQQAVVLANQAYANTGIPIRLVLARVMSAGAYTESSNIETDLNRLAGFAGVTLQNVRDARETYDADLVALWRKSDPSFCGIANLTDNPTNLTDDIAYHVMNWQCVSNYSFHHEMGHNMGLRHDRFVDPTPGVGYNHGFVNKLAACRVRTVMAYNNDCTTSGFSCTRINMFSTGSFTYGANSCRIGRNKSGATAREDNTQRLKETRTVVGGYR